ncbi:MAG: hypothetical protein IPF92_13080 [Myxococcales bacterium]|nr:hypothetical protein [Myxococcales bacterium]
MTRSIAPPWPSTASGSPRKAALALLRAEFNPRCKPAWSERELARKVREVARSRFPAGYLLEGRRAS